MYTGAGIEGIRSDMAGQHARNSDAFEGIQGLVNILAEGTQGGANDSYQQSNMTSQELQAGAMEQIALVSQKTGSSYDDILGLDNQGAGMLAF
jgi:hypothetical protein